MTTQDKIDLLYRQNFNPGTNALLKEVLDELNAGGGGGGSNNPETVELDGTGLFQFDDWIGLDFSEVKRLYMLRYDGWDLISRTANTFDEDTGTINFNYNFNGEGYLSENIE